MPGTAAKVVITERQKEVLELFVRRPTSAQSLVTRANIILLAFAKRRNDEIAQLLGMERHAISKWRVRGKKAFDRFCRGYPLSKSFPNLEFQFTKFHIY